MNEFPVLLPYLRRLFDGRTHELPQGHCIVGRSEDCDLVLDEPGLSRKHARITVDDEQISLFDLGSLNGTLVNGSEALSKLSLQHGDIIVFDDIEYELLIPGDAANKREASAARETVVANRRERDHEDLIQSEVRVVDDAFLARDATGNFETEAIEDHEDHEDHEGTVGTVGTESTESAESAESTEDTTDSVITSISQPTLIIRGTGAAGVRMPLDMRRSEWTIGSSIDQDISIAHPSVADAHATLNVSAGQWTLSVGRAGEDVQVNGQVIDYTDIASGDVIRIGEIECLFVCPRKFSDTQLTQPPQESPGAAGDLPIREQTFDASDMAPIGWRDTREPVPKRGSRALTLIGSLLALMAIAAALFIWRNMS